MTKKEIILFMEKRQRRLRKIEVKNESKKSTEAMRRQVCIATLMQYLILKCSEDSDYHVISSKKRLQKMRDSLKGGHLTTAGRYGVLRLENETILMFPKD